MAKMPPMDGIYNMPLDPEMPCKYYQTVRRLPSAKKFARESEGIADRLCSVIEGYLQDIGIAQVNDCLEETFSEQSVGEFPTDRTMCFFVGHLKAFTPDLVAVLQRQVLGDFPLWRLLAQYDEKKIGIYPSGAWLGGSYIDGTFDKDHAAYGAWLADARVFHEQRFGPLRRQLSQVRLLIPGAIVEARRYGYVPLATFDSFPPHDPTHAVWLLQTKPPYELFADTGFSPIRKSVVQADGTIFPQFYKEVVSHTDIEPEFWLVTYSLQPSDCHRIAMKTTAEKVFGHLDIREIIRDDDLKAKEEKENLL